MTDVSNPHDYDNHNCYNSCLCRISIQSSYFVKCKILVNLTIILSYWHILQAATTDHLVFLKKAGFYLYNNNTYNIQSAVDPRHPKMEPILCFLPDQVVAPDQMPQQFDTRVRGSQVFRHHYAIVFSLYSFIWFFALSYLDFSGQM